MIDGALQRKAISGEFQAEIDVTDGGGVQTYRFDRTADPLTFRDVISLWRWNEHLIDFMCELIRTSGLQGYVWECPPVTQESLNRQFEFTLISTGKPYHNKADPSSFSEHFSDNGSEDDVAVFYNLGGDATLVVPEPVGTLTDYRDLHRFLKNGSRGHKLALFQTLSETIKAELSDKPLWLSVAGSGEPWLHFRLDTRPKYYQYAPYRRP